MAKHIWSLISRESKIDDQNNITIIDSYENLQFGIDTHGESYDPGKPFVIPFNFEVTSLFYRDKKGTEELYDEEVVVLDPSSKELGKFSIQFKFQPEHNRMRNRIKFNRIALTKTGTYIFQVYLKPAGDSKKDLVAAIPVDIQVSINGKAT